MRILGIIPARGGSKGIPKKNIRLLGGRPLIAWRVLMAKNTPEVYRTVVTTDTEEIAAVARSFGADVPFLRPAELAADKSPTVPAVQHAVRFVEEQDGQQIDAVLLLQPTGPFGIPADVTAMIAMMEKTGCDSVVSHARLIDHHPARVKRMDEEGRVFPFSDAFPEPEGKRRQDFTPFAYIRDGAFYLATRALVMEQNSLWGGDSRGYVMPPERVVNIDEPVDFLTADAMAMELLQNGFPF